MEYKCLSDFLFKGENKNINISVSKNSPVNASLSLDGYKHSMVQIIALTIALKMKTVIVNPPIVSDTYSLLLRCLQGRVWLHQPLVAVPHIAHPLRRFHRSHRYRLFQSNAP